jgi:hypothetical protein
MILAQRPDDGFVRLMLALALRGQRRIGDALVEYKRLYEDDPSIQHGAFVADVLARLGDREPALGLLQRLRETADHEFVPAMVIAWLHLHLGDVEAAVTAIEQAYEVCVTQVRKAKREYCFGLFVQSLFPRKKTSGVSNLLNSPAERQWPHVMLAAGASPRYFAMNCPKK